MEGEGCVYGRSKECAQNSVGLKSWRKVWGGWRSVEMGWRKFQNAG